MDLDTDSSTQSGCENVTVARESYTRLKKEPERVSPAEKEAHLSLWDSLESDTESLAQERLYQMQLQSRIHQGNELVNSGTEGATDGQEEEVGEEEEEEDEDDSEEDLGEQDNYIYDSLDVTALRLGKRKPTPDNDGVQEVLQEEKSKVTLRHTQVEDEYASLRYDPNWRSNVKGAQHFGEGRTQLLLEEEIYHDTGEASGEGPWQQMEFSRSGARENASARGHVPAVSFVAGVADHGGPKSKPPPTPYRPSLQANPLSHTGSPASTRPRQHEQFDQVEGMESDRSLGALSGAMNQAYTGENHVSHELEESYEKMNKRYAREYQVFYEQESARTNETMNSKQEGVHYKLKQSHRLSNARPVKPKEDIVERNKMTLGVRRRQGSYLRAHGQRGEKEHTNQEPEAMEEISNISSQGSQDNILDPELRWQQNTQRLKVYQEKKRQGREGKHLKPIVKRQSPSGSGTVVGDQSGTDNPSVPWDGRGAQGRPLRLGHAEVLVIDGADAGSTAGTSRSPAVPALWWRPDHPAARTPTFNVNINLSTSSDATPFLSSDHQQASITLSPTQRPPLGPSLAVYNPTTLSCYHDRQVNPAQMASYYSPRQLALGPQTAAPARLVPNPDFLPGRLNQGRPFLWQDCGSERSGVPRLWDHENSSVHRMDYTRAWVSPTKWQTAAVQNLYQDPGDQHIVLQCQEGQRLRQRQPSQSSGSYKVLPPIGQTVASDTELSSQSPRQQINPIQRSSSEGYLAQLVRQKQLKEKTTYKAYSLKDYKALKQDVKLGGLGPNYKVTEMTAEKIRRQKQYSNKVREQNKNLSRNPFLPAKNPMGSDTREDIVPRRKALEYARSIPKPRPPPHPKNREAGKEDFHEPLGYLEDIDLSQLARLEMLQKRHEEEKQVVAHFKALHVI
ncbi:hypothetical protein MATL_G00039890 [Megalops atlanticus]|uniref:Jhy protein homolog n=1 Tax=Megalops atlanticus TaxID=7932 RepID=A0A9D3QC34_MEGAT|nr:hypothetical protein MATL_G00039890 [Megalops atlanticus]